MNQILTINSFKQDNYGIYKCIASVNVKNFPSIESSIKVIPPGAPSIYAESKQYLSYGETGYVECFIETEPKADVCLFIIILNNY